MSEQIQYDDGGWSREMVLAPCTDCGHLHVEDGCSGPPTPSDLWAGVSVSKCDCNW